MTITLTTHREQVTGIPSSVAVVGGLGEGSSGQLLLVTVQNANVVSTAQTPTFEGAGATWVQVATIASSNGLNRLTVFRAQSAGTPYTTGATTVRFAAAQDLIAYSLAAFAGTSTASTDGAHAVAQVVSTAASTAGIVTLSLGAFGESSNAAYGAFGQPSSNAWTTGAGFSIVSEARNVDALSATPISLLTEWRNSASTAISATGSTAVFKLGIGIEIREPVQETRNRRLMMGVGR